MRARTRTVTISALAAVIITAVIFARRPAEPNEPTYGGHPLSFWLSQYDTYINVADYFPESPDFQQKAQAREAIRMCGEGVELRHQVVKKALIALSVLVTTTTTFGQGLLSFQNTSLTLISAGPNRQVINGPQGSYYFALLIATPVSPYPVDYTFAGVYATNDTTPGFINGGASVAVPGWPPGAAMYYKIAGWSADLGHDWNPAWLQTNFPGASASSVFGLSDVGTSDSGTSSPWDLFGPGTGIDILMTGFNMSPVIAPAQVAGPLVWTASTNAPINEWFSVASSADGTNLVAVVYGGGIYTSTDSGVTWTSNNVPAANWYSVACSADGQKLVAAANGLGSPMFSSVDGGGHWLPTAAPASPFQSWTSVASSSDGTKLVASGTYALTRHIYTSADSGASWTTTSAPNLSWYSVASSGDGTKLVSIAWQNDLIYTSVDSGTNWSPNPVPSNAWYSVASSYDGSRLVAVANSGGVFTSTNSGINWVSNDVPSAVWRGVACSADGTKLVAAGPGLIYTSADSGTTWTSNNVPDTTYWTSVACSADGTKLVAVAATGEIYTAQAESVFVPALSIRTLGSNTLVAWPNWTPGFHLQSSSDLTATGWLDVGTPPTLTNGQNQLILSSSNAKNFYRLKFN